MKPKVRQIDEWNRRQSIIAIHTFGEVIYNKYVKTIQLGREDLFNKWCGGKSLQQRVLEKSIGKSIREIEPCPYSIP